MTTILLTCPPPPSSALNFNFTAFTGDDTNITYEEAFPADNAIQLTRNLLGSTLNSSIGRATYSSPLPLWDPISRNLTDFQTHFIFSIFSQYKDGYGDGFAFFLAPFDSKLSNASIGGTLGLTDGAHGLNTTTNRFVAVEFDIFSNDFDPLPLGRHLGIDINSLRSVRTIPWAADVMGGRRSEAWISYDSSTRNLSVAVSGFVRDVGIVQTLSYIIDFREYLPEQVRFGFSGSTGDQVAIHRIHSWDFSSTLEVGNRGRKGNRVALFSGLFGGIFGALIVLICLGFVFKKRIGKNGDDGFEMDEEFEKGAGPSKFSFKELARATNNFNERDNKLGEGGFGKVYKGYLKDKEGGGKLLIAVKRVSRKSSQGMKEFAAEVKIISRLRHRNLVQLIGWCNEKKELLLVYEFLPNGSLDFHLFQQKEKSWLLNWEMRYKIAKGLASGLLYLHEEWEQCVVHRDIKSSNVMLDSNFNAKLGDFGLARLVDHDKGSQTTLLAGTMGYLAPECAITGKASRESDVFSFGVVLLEIATARRPAVKVKQQEVKDEAVVVHLVEWVWSLYGDGRLMMEAPDQKLDREYEGEEMERLLMVGLWCAHPDSSSRPSVRQALQLLNFEAPLPVLPLNMPVATYGGAQMSEVSLAFSPSTTMADVDLQRRQFSCEFNASDGVAPSPLGKSSNAVTF
ncbi:L-type lectin-domain containing receptor kinase IX.1 [Linum perenne]